MIRLALAIVAALFGLMAVPARADDDLARLAALCAPDIHVTTLSAVVQQESAGHPFAINVNGAKALPRQARSAAEAVATAQALLDHGYNIDVGLGQVNSDNFPALGLSLAELFSPCANLQASARILSGCYARAVTVYGEGQAALQAALSCYNTGSFRDGIANGYVRKVAARVPALLPLQSSPTVRPAPPPRAGGEPDVFAASGDADAFAGEAEMKRRYGDNQK